MTDRPALMLDTNVFNRVLSGAISSTAFAGYRVIVTGIQRDELSRTRDESVRVRLMAVFDLVQPVVVPAESFALDIEGAGWGQARWNDGSGTIKLMRNRLQQLDRKQGRRKEPLNQERDILIAEAAIKGGAILVTDDTNLRQVTEEFGGTAVACAELPKYGARPG